MNKNLTNIALTAGGLNVPPQNAPSQYANRQKRYFEAETARFIKDNAYLASNFFKGMIQGLNADEPFLWEEYPFRLADVTTTAISSDKQVDDYKEILIASDRIVYIPQGSKVEVMGSTWLVTNPKNISTGQGSAVIQHCNATYNTYDYYLNLRKEPIVVETAKMAANANDDADTILLMNGYFNIFAQYNEVTAQLTQNARLILGENSYAVTGSNSFEVEFTDDFDSVRLLRLTARVSEPNSEIDDIKNRVAGGLTQSWEIVIA